MTPLIDALTAAQKAGFQAPKCRECSGRKTYIPNCVLCDDSTYDHECPGPVPCRACGATGVDLHQPILLVGLAHCWLSERGLLDSSKFMESWSDCADGETKHREHDGTSAGRATAMLRLVACAGGES